MAREGCTVKGIIIINYVPPLFFATLFHYIIVALSCEVRLFRSQSKYGSLKWLSTAMILQDKTQYSD